MSFKSRQINYTGTHKHPIKYIKKKRTRIICLSATLKLEYIHCNYITNKMIDLVNMLFEQQLINMS